jgi:hypothetical protein
MTDQTKPTDDAIAPAVAAAPPIVIAERPHLDMRREDMFPETPGGPGPDAEKASVGYHDRPDEGPRDMWIVRITEELTPTDVLRLFQQPPHLITRRVLAAIDELYGPAAVKVRQAPIPGVDQTYRHPKRSRLRRLAERAACRFLDLVPAGELRFAQEQFTQQREYRAIRERLVGARDMAGDLRDAVVAIERAIFPGLRAEKRVGKTWRGERVVAVWAGIDPHTGAPTKPTGEPEF